MNKKKVAAMVVSLALVAVIGIGATLAYFTDQTGTKTNVVTMGKVDIDLTESTTDGTLTDAGITYDKIMPGDELNKVPVVTVAGDSQDAYIRVKLDITSANFGDVTPAEIQSYLNINEVDWALGADGYLYYQGIVKANDKLTVFDTVTIPTTLGNEVAGGSFRIVVQADAIQADNVTPTTADNKIVGWPAADIAAFN